MNLTREIHERVLKGLLEPPAKLDTRGIPGPYGMLVIAQGDRPRYSIVDQASFFENVPDFPRDRVGPDWLLVAVGDDNGTSLFCYPWDEVKRVIE